MINKGIKIRAFLRKVIVHQVNVVSQNYYIRC